MSKNKRVRSDAEKAAIRKYYAQKNASRKPSRGRTASGRVPQGRTLSTHDNYLGDGKKTGSTKRRPVVVIETNEANELAVVPLSSRAGNNRTRLKNYQQGQSYFKHFVEIYDDEGKPIRVNNKFRENHSNMDLSKQDIAFIMHKVFDDSMPQVANKKKIEQFRKRGK